MKYGYRLIRKDDIDNVALVIEYCRAHGLDEPYADKYIMADDGTSIVGIVGVIAHGEDGLDIEPIAADIPVIAVNLYNMALGYATLSGKSFVQVTSVEDKLTKMAPIFEKLGFSYVGKTYVFAKEL